MLDMDTIAELIAANTVKFHSIGPAIIPAVLIDALADAAEAESGNLCDASGCDEEGHRCSSPFDRDPWVAKCRGE